MDEKRRQVLLSLSNLKETDTQTDPIFFQIKSPDFCFSCGRPIFNKSPDDYMILRCDHIFCMSCINKFAHAQISNPNNYSILCPLCSVPLNEQEIDRIDKTYNKTLNSRFLSTLGTVVSCPKCKTDFILECGEFDANTKDSEGENYRPEAIDSYKKYRVTCSVCQTNFCANCKSIPFHEALTCEEKQMFDDDIFCRFCTVFPPIGGKLNDVCHRVCWHERCRESIGDACNHVCECGHACCGIKGEMSHFGCALCNYERYSCQVCKRSCTESPSVVMRCGHPIHKSCLIGKYLALDDKYGIKIPLCEICNEVMFHECVKDKAVRCVEYDKKIKELIRIRMEIEDTKNEINHVKNPEDKDYFGNPEKFARDFFTFYICEKCGEPFYAGHHECDGALLDADNGHHLCLKCNKDMLNSVCKKHGESGMVYKCFFCCSPALFFCFGTTHFCPKCHERPHDVQKGPFPPCDGHCPFAPHPPNGQKQIFGYCVLCEQEKEDKMLHNK